MTSKLTREQVIALIAEHSYDSALVDALEYLAAAMDSEPVELPLDYLQGHKDGLEWAAQLAKANHPETGGWLYDDPIELAKAISKGPDMPPSQPALDGEPVAWKWRLVDLATGDPGEWRVTLAPSLPGKGAGYRTETIPLYLHAQPAQVVPDDVSIFEAAIEECKTCDSIDEHAWNHGVLAVIAKYESCRAAMLAAAPQEVK